jgi:hypothetical protein
MLLADTVAVDCAAPAELAEFWLAALGWERDPEEDDDRDEVGIVAPAGRGDSVRQLLFIRVPEGKRAKNRLHRDLRPADQDAEVERLVGLGARRADVGQGEEVTWMVLADPGDNEFCVLRALPARA